MLCKFLDPFHRHSINCFLLSLCRSPLLTSFGCWIIHPISIRQLLRMFFICGCNNGMNRNGRPTQQLWVPTIHGKPKRQMIWLRSWLPWQEETPLFPTSFRAYVMCPSEWWIRMWINSPCHIGMVIYNVLITIRHHFRDFDKRIYLYIHVLQVHLFL